MINNEGFENLLIYSDCGFRSHVFYINDVAFLVERERASKCRFGVLKRR
jgi:hypothetical protein